MSRSCLTFWQKIYNRPIQAACEHSLPGPSQCAQVELWEEDASKPVAATRGIRGMEVFGSQGEAKQCSKEGFHWIRLASAIQNHESFFDGSW